MSAAPQSPPSGAQTRHPWLGLVAISLGVSLVVVDFTIVNVLIPPIITDLKISSLDAQWVQESYAIALASLLLVMGRLSDILGARRLFLAGTVVFGVASIAAALAPSGDLLIASRLLQGVGGSIVIPTSLALLNASFRGADRGKAFAIWGSTIGASAAVGPLLGGWLGEISWRWAFGINIVVVVLIIAGVLLFLAPSVPQPSRLDLVGSALSVLGLGLLAFGLIEGRNYGWWSAKLDSGPLGLSLGDVSVIPVALALATLSLGLFVVQQRRLTRTRAPEPLMDTDLFKIRSFSTGNFATVIIGLAEFGILAVLPLWLQFTLGYSTLQTGLMIVAVAGGSFMASGASFGMAEKMSPVRLVQLGLVLEAAGLLLLAVLASPDSSWVVIAVGLVLYGAGVGFATAQVTNVVLVDVPPKRAGQGSGIQSASRQLGSALGIAMLTTIFFGVLGSSLDQALQNDGVSAAESARISVAVSNSAGSVIPSLAADPATAETAAAAREAMTHALEINGYTCAGLLLLGLLATLLIPRKPTASPEQADDEFDRVDNEAAKARSMDETVS